MSATENVKMSEAMDRVLNQAQRQKVDLEVLATARRSTTISHAQRKLDQFSFSETHQLGLRVIDGNFEGVAYTESLAPESLDLALSEARANARMIQKEWVGELHGGDLKQSTLKGIFNPELEDVPVEAKLRASAELESAALEFDRQVVSVWNFLRDSSSTVWIANTKGLSGTYKQNSCMAQAGCLVQDGSATVSAGEAEMARGFSGIDTRRIAVAAATKAISRQGAERPLTSAYTVVFENRMAENILALIGDYFSAKSVDENTSPLKGKLGQTVFSEKLSLLDDPFFVRAPGCRPFDEEGFLSRKTTLVENGVLKNFLTNSVLSRKMNLPHTASGSRAPSTDLDVGASNILVRPGKATLQDLLNADGRVILVTTVLGTAGFRRTSGDFSIPMEGVLYEQGVAKAPLKDFLICGNILQLLAGVEGVGNDVRDPIGSVISPSLLVRGLNVVGRSQ